MSIPVSNIPAPQITPPQIVTPKPAVAPQSTVAAPQPATQAAAPVAPQQETLPAAKKLGNQNKTDDNGMTLPKAGIGVVNPPQDIYQHSMNKDFNEKYQNKKEVINAATPMASSSLAQTSSGGGFFSKLLLVGGTIAAGVFAAKKFKLSSIASGNISSLKEVQGHLKDLITTSKKGAIKPFNLKKTSVRVIDETSDNIKELLNTTRKIAAEARNVEGKTPKIVIKLNETANDVQKTIKEAISKNKIDSLPSDVLKKIEYINLDYVHSDKKSTEVIINTVASKFTDEGSSFSGGWSKAEKFLKDFLGD